MKLNGDKNLLVLVFIVVLTITPTMSNAHSFVWGVDVGDTFTYALQRKVLDTNYAPLLPYWMSFVTSIDEGTKFNATIKEMDEIPETITTSDQIPLSHAVLVLEDNTTLLADSTAFAILIGDWEFHGELLNFSSDDPERTIIDTDEEWGLIEDSAFSLGGQIYEYLFEWRYEKSTGTLAYSRYRVTTLGSDLIDIIISQWHEGDPTILPREIQLITVLMVALGMSVGVIIAILVYRWAKTPRGLAAELGR